MRIEDSAWARRVGYGLSGLFIAFMVFDVGIKLAGLPIVAQSLEALGWRPTSGLTIGLLELGALALYVVPRTAVLGALLVTAILGGAVATHLRIGSPLVSHVLFGVYLGLFAWGGLWLRDPSLRALLPLRR